MKVCTKCHRKFPATAKFWHRHRERNDGLANICKECKREQHKEYLSRPGVKEERRRTQKAYYRRPEIRAKILAYHKDRRRCPEIRKKEIARQKEYQQRPEVREKIKAYQKAYRQRPEVKEKTKERLRIFRQRPGAKARKNRKERIRAQRPDVKAKNNKYAKEYVKRRRREDAEYRILTLLRARVQKAIKRGDKTAATRELIGCSTDHLCRHLESKFQVGMSWENHGPHGWHIDHIVPCAAFDLTDPEQQKICFNWANLQPLWAKDNRRKLAKTDGQLMLI